MKDNLLLLKEFVKNYFRYYPAVWGLLFLLTGILCGYYLFFDMGGSSGLFVVPGLFLIFLTLKSRSPRLFFLTIATLFFGIGVHTGSTELFSADAFNAPEGRQVIHATVSEIWSIKPSARTFILDEGFNISNNQPLPACGRMVLIDNPVELTAGDRIAIRSQIKKPVNRGNPGEYDWEADCISNGIMWLTTVQGKNTLLVLEKGSEWDFRRQLFKARQAMYTFLHDNTGVLLGGIIDPVRLQNVRGFLKAITVGDYGELDYDLIQSFSRSGLVHILSASGVHVTIIAASTVAFVGLLVRLAPSVLLWVPLRKLGACFVIPVITFYCFLVGARVPAIRSTIMGLVVAAAFLLGRSWHSFNTLAIAGILVLINSPLSVFTPSFQLSFSATAAILLVIPELTKRVYLKELDPEKPATGPSLLKRLLMWAGLLTATSAAATIACVPILIQDFHSFPIFSIPANLAGEIFMTPGLALGLLAAAVGAVFPMLGKIILAPAEFCCWLVVEVSYFISSLPFSVATIGHLSSFEVILVVIGAVSLIAFLRNPSLPNVKPTIVPAGIALALLMFSITIRGYQTDLKVVFLSVGKGDAILIKPPRASGIIFDGGIASDHFDTGKSIILPFLAYEGVSRLGAMALSHPEMDHMGGLPAVLQKIPAQKLWWNPVPSDSKHLAKLLDCCQRSGGEIKAVDRRLKPLELGGAKITFLNPHYKDNAAAQHKDLNNASVIMKVDFGKTSFLFTGDLEIEGELELLRSGLDLSATVLKAGHHGGKNSTGQEFLDKVRPKIAVISAEFPPRQNLPNLKTLERLQLGGAEILWTGRDGAITLKSNGRDISVTCGKKQRLSY